MSTLVDCPLNRCKWVLVILALSILSLVNGGISHAQPAAPAATAPLEFEAATIKLVKDPIRADCRTGPTVAATPPATPACATSS